MKITSTRMAATRSLRVSSFYAMPERKRQLNELYEELRVKGSLAVDYARRLCSSSSILANRIKPQPRTRTATRKRRIGIAKETPPPFARTKLEGL